MSSSNDFAVVAVDTGVIVRIGQASDESLALQADEGQLTMVDAIPDGFSDPSLVEADLPDGMTDETHYWDGVAFQVYPARPVDPHYWNGTAWITYGPQPNPFCVFDRDAGEWVDPRSQADYDGALHHSRMHTEIPTGLAIHKLAEIGAYPMAEIANDAVGIPATIREFIDLPEFPQFERDLMLAYFKTMPTVPRSMTRVFGPIHPDDPGDGYPSFIPWLATAKSITISAEQLDILWGVDVPPPLYSAP